MQTLLERSLDLARLVLRLGQVRRVTRHPDGEPESDATHSVMLSMLAYGMAHEACYPVAPDRVALLAMVHDLAEAYVGDTPTTRGLDPDARERKERRERAALAIVFEDLAGFPPLLELLREYEAQETAESRFVRFVDKLLPKLTHILDDGCSLRAQGLGIDDVRESHRAQGAELRATYPELTGLAVAFDEFSQASEERLKSCL